MKNIIALLIIALIIAFTACSETKQDILKNKDISKMPQPDKLIDRISYMIGYSMGKNLEKDSIYNINLEYVVAGIRNVLENKDLLMDKTLMDSTMKEYQVILDQRTKSKMLNDLRAVEDNKKEAYAFLEENKKNKDIIVTPSGLQYKIIKNGSGNSPKPGDYLKLHAVATVYNGEEFDNSYKRNKPIFLQMTPNLLKAWAEALQLMKKGSKWMIYAPAELAMGDKGNEKVPPNKLLIFELELLDFQIQPYEESPMAPKMESRNDTMKLR